MTAEHVPTTWTIWVETDAERIKRLMEPNTDGAPWMAPVSRPPAL